MCARYSVCVTPNQVGFADIEDVSDRFLRYVGRFHLSSTFGTNTWNCVYAGTLERSSLQASTFDIWWGMS